MRTFDFSPLFRSSIGFDHVASLLDTAARTQQNTGYPPYNIEVKDKDSYCITLAIAGFSENELSLETEQNTLRVRGIKNEANSDNKYLHQGIAARNFERHFQLADFVKVTDAKLDNGLLHIDLTREIPDAMKPRKIEIQKMDDKLLDRSAA